MIATRDTSRRLDQHARVIFIAVALLPALIVVTILWVLPLDTSGTSHTAMAARDYTDIWAAGHLVASRQSDALFDLARFNAALQSMFGAGFPHQVWPYPPTILLLAVPISMLPLIYGFLLYTAGTVGLLWLALRSGGMTRTACAAVLFSPAVADNASAAEIASERNNSRI